MDLLSRNRKKDLRKCRRHTRPRVPRSRSETPRRSRELGALRCATCGDEQVLRRCERSGESCGPAAQQCWPRLTGVVHSPERREHSNANARPVHEQLNDTPSPVARLPPEPIPEDEWRRGSGWGSGAGTADFTGFGHRDAILRLHPRARHRHPRGVRLRMAPRLRLRDPFPVAGGLAEAR